MRLRDRYDSVLAEVPAPFAFVDLDALGRNARALVRQARGLPVRVASKSVRCAPVLRRILGLDEQLRGILSFTLPEALHLFRQGIDEDIFVGYPATDPAALAELALLAAERPGDHPALIVDAIEHLDLIARVVPPGAPPIRVAIEIDTSWWPVGGRVAKIGPKRSPIRTPEAAQALAREIGGRPQTRLVGAMAYEGHIAGVGDVVPGNPLRAVAIRAMQGRSLAELRERVPRVLAAITDVIEEPLEWVNAGGTGSLSRTRELGYATELTAGSGFYAPALFDRYRSLELEPAAAFCLPIARRPSADVATALGGGYIASGVPGGDRSPVPWLPPGLELDSDEGAGEVQTPLVGEEASQLKIGDRVYFRHAKAGELCERFDSLFLVEGDRIADEVPTYRGEGRAFL